jgi:hypothetical protein
MHKGVVGGIGIVFANLSRQFTHHAKSLATLLAQTSAQEHNLFWVQAAVTPDQ